MLIIPGFTFIFLIKYLAKYDDKMQKTEEDDADDESEQLK